MNNYKFRISGPNITIDVVKDHINKYIGDSIVGQFTDFTGPTKEADGMAVYGKLRDTNSSLDTVRKNFINAFNNQSDYIAIVDQIL